MVYSFDIFDTLVTRKTFSPYGIFSIVQEKIAESTQFPVAIRKNFRNIRINAEKNARLWSANEEVTFDEIYGAMQKMTHLNDELINMIMELEIETEIDMTIGITTQIAFLKSVIEQGNSVVLISDMYLSQTQIRRILSYVDDIFDELPIYVSSEFGMSKRSGNLYAIVRKIENITDAWIHIGDNAFSDYRVPKLMGIQAQLLSPEYYNSWDDYIRSGDLPEITKELLLGVVKSNICKRGRIGKEYAIGASIGGHILWPYVKWIVEYAYANNIKELYFFARDGYLLKQIADIYIEKLDASIKTRYVYASRKSLREESNSRALIEYFRGLIGNNTDVYFVDLQGTGESVRCLVEHLSELEGIRYHIFYYVMLEDRMQDDVEWMVYTSKLVRSPIELFCRAPHGATLAYEFEGDEAKPVIKEIDERIWKNSHLDDYIEGVCDWTKEVCMLDKSLLDRISWNAVSDVSLKYIVETSNMEILDFLGELPHDELNYNDEKYAPVLSNRDLFLNYYVRTSEDENTYYDGTDLQMSLRRATDFQRKLVRWYNLKYDSKIGDMLRPQKIKVPYLKNKRVVVYGAGKIGEDAYRALHGIQKVKVVGWIDKNDVQYVARGLNVISIERLRALEYDLIVIALSGNRENNKTIKEVYDFLCNIGVPEEKIVEWNVLRKEIEHI